MQPISLELCAIQRSFQQGTSPVTVLKPLSLRINPGEMLAIVGASGSGKSTLMNILGCLDKPSSGQYLIAGQDVRLLSSDQLATLRREHFGFIFQSYHLLPHLSALDNVAMPAVYAGLPLAQRRERALKLLSRLGLADKAALRPHQLSGGQQQRVSVARSLMNGGSIILADEPTGALDSHSGAEVMAILKDLHQAGHTVIIVTHDPSIAAQTQRIIEIRDGEVLHDQRHVPIADPGYALEMTEAGALRRPRREHLLEAVKMAMLTLLANRMRTLLTALGIIIGIASVVSIIAVGDAARDYVLDDIRAIGPNTITIVPGRERADDLAMGVRSFLPGDLSALAAEPYVDSVTPVTLAMVRLRYRRTSVALTAMGVSQDYFRVEALKILEGVGLSAEDIRLQRQVTLIDSHLRQKLFAREEALGKIILIGSVPVAIIGVVEAKEEGVGGEKNYRAWLPYSTAASRLFGQQHFDWMVVRVKESQPMTLAEQAITRLLTHRHGSKDFYTQNLDELLKTMESTGRSLAMLLAMIAANALLVGGVGVMNIMLVSVTERTREIGIRMAVGARQRDVLQQFLTESVLVCLMGGGVGIALSYLINWIIEWFLPDWKIAVSLTAMLLAVLCSSLIGVLFGYLPARNAARLNPIDALARE